MRYTIYIYSHTDYSFTCTMTDSYGTWLIHNSVNLSLDVRLLVHVTWRIQMYMSVLYPLGFMGYDSFACARKHAWLLFICTTYELTQWKSHLKILELTLYTNTGASYLSSYVTQRSYFMSETTRSCVTWLILVWHMYKNRSFTPRLLRVWFIQLPCPSFTPRLLLVWLTQLRCISGTFIVHLYFKWPLRMCEMSTKLRCTWRINHRV